jgi:hypothetical protein
MKLHPSGFLILIVGAVALIGFAEGLGRSLADCQAVASNFQNTCSGAPTTAASSVASMEGGNVSCTLTGNDANYCAGSYSGTTCTWTRRLCVTCSSTNSVVYIRVQSNSLPAHCYKAPATPLAQTIDFSVPFNPAVSIDGATGLPTPRAAKNDPQNQAAVTALLCGAPNAITPNSDCSGLTFVGGADTLGTGVGVSLSGVTLLNGNSADKVDPFYPKAYGTVTNTVPENVDICVGHPSFTAVYHYHIMPTCHSGSQYITQAAPCGGPNAATCGNRLKDFALDSWSQNKTLTVAGIAKDGRVIYGPYWGDGSLVSAGLDVCNGAYFDEDGDGSKDTYAYFMTKTFPYFAGCIGPGNFPAFQPECTTNPLPAYVSTIPSGPVAVAQPVAAAAPSAAAQPKSASQPTATKAPTAPVSTAPNSNSNASSASAVVAQFCVVAFALFAFAML